MDTCKRRLPDTFLLPLRNPFFSRVWAVLAVVTLLGVTIAATQELTRQELEVGLLATLASPSVVMILIAWWLHRGGITERELYRQAREGEYEIFWDFDIADSDWLADQIRRRRQTVFFQWFVLPVGIGFIGATLNGFRMAYTGVDVWHCAKFALTITTTVTCLVGGVYMIRWLVALPRLFVLKHSKLGVLFLKDRICIAGECVIPRAWGYPRKFTLETDADRSLLVIDLIRKGTKSVQRFRLKLPVPNGREQDLEQIKNLYDS